MLGRRFVHLAHARTSHHHAVGGCFSCCVAALRRRRRRRRRWGWRRRCRRRRGNRSWSFEVGNLLLGLDDRLRCRLMRFEWQSRTRNVCSCGIFCFADGRSHHDIGRRLRSLRWLWGNLIPRSTGTRLILEDSERQRNTDNGDNGRSRESAELPLVRRPPIFLRARGRSIGNSVEVPQRSVNRFPPRGRARRRWRGQRDRTVAIDRHRPVSLPNAAPGKS